MPALSSFIALSLSTSTSTFIMTYFLVEQTLVAGEKLTLTKETAHHLLHVRRIKIGETVHLQGQDGNRFEAVMLERLQQKAVLEMTSLVQPPPLPTQSVRIIQAVLKDKSCEWLIQKSTELGVAELWFVGSERAQRARNSAIERWQKIALSACMQCGRQYPPVLRWVPSLVEALTDNQQPFLHGWVLSHSAQQSLYEGMQAQHSTQGSAVLIGPEGGLTEAETTLAAQHHWQPVHLGGITLRAETAALTAAAICLYAH